MARSMASFGTLSLRAFSSAAARRELVAGSAPPCRAAMVISRMNFPVACDFFREATSRLANNHCLPMGRRA